MNYFLWISGVEHGPYSLAQIQEAIDGGEISTQQTARTEDNNDWKPLINIAPIKVPPPKPLPASMVPKTPPPMPLPPQYVDSSLAAVFQFFAVLNFVAGLLGIFPLVNRDSDASNIGLIIIALGIGGGLTLLAFAKVIQCLHEMVFRLRSLEQKTNQR